MAGLEKARADGLARSTAFSLGTECSCKRLCPARANLDHPCGILSASARYSSPLGSVTPQTASNSGDEASDWPAISLWRTKGEYATLWPVVLRTCTVAVKDIRDVEHSIEVTAETLYEAIATALAALQRDNWVGEIGQGFTTVTVVVQQPPVKHEVKMKDFVSWLGRQGRSPAEVILKQKLEKILGKANHARK